MSVPVWRRPAEISCLLAGSSECSRRTRARRAREDRWHTRTAESRTSRYTDPLMLRDAYIHLQHHLIPAPPPLIHCGQNLTSLEICWRRILKFNEDSAEQYHLTETNTPLRTHFSTINLLMLILENELHIIHSTEDDLFFINTKAYGWRSKVIGHGGLYSE